MTSKTSVVESQCKLALTKIDEAIDKHMRGESADLSVDVLHNVRAEIDQMLKYLNPERYSPSYARFILDSWEDQHGLVDFLAEVSYNYKSIRG